MPIPRRSHLRTASWLAAALLLALAVIGVVVELQGRADAGRDAQVRLARVVTELQALQELPWEADVEEGGDPRLVRAQLEAGERQMRGTLSELRGRSAPPQLAAVQGPLGTNVAALERARASVAAEQ